MALGGGTFVIQNKPLAGTYVNIISKVLTTNELSQRGSVGLLFAGTTTESFPVNTVMKIAAVDFENNAEKLFGVKANDATLQPIREVFKNATYAYVYKVDSKAHTGEAIVTNYTNFLKAIQAYPVNVVVCNSESVDVIEDFVEFVKDLRDNHGVKIQVVVPYVEGMVEPNYEGVVCVRDNATLVYWVGGACAGCAINASLTNKIYNGELELSITHSQTELVSLLESGYFVFHKVSDEYRVLEDVNTLTSTTDNNVDVNIMKYNQSVRIADQIATDSAIIFNNEFLGKVQNNADGRVSLWNRIVDNRKELERLGAIENYDSKDTTVSMGDSKRAVVINDKVTIVNAMSQLYLTVVVQ